MPDIARDFWQLGRLTWSYVARAFSGAILLATGIIEDNPITIVVAALFLPFLAQLLAVISNLAISAIIGVTAGLSCADDSGRYYLIGVAAAVQLAVFPVWLGIALVVGVPSREMVVHNLLSFAINLVTIATASVVAYALAHRQMSRSSA